MPSVAKFFIRTTIDLLRVIPITAMPQKRKSGYDASDSFVVEDDDQDNGATTKATKRSKKDTNQASTFTTALPAPSRDKEKNLYWEISKARRVTVSEFKGKQMISVREYYEKDGDWLPGKKGISMTLDQYAGLISVLPGIEKELRRSGIQDVPRPDYSSVDNAGGGIKTEVEDEDDTEQGADTRANHEATSDEDD